MWSSLESLKLLTGWQVCEWGTWKTAASRSAASRYGLRSARLWFRPASAAMAGSGNWLKAVIRSLMRLFFQCFDTVQIHWGLYSMEGLLSGLLAMRLIHSHHERAPGWSVAVSTSYLHRSLSWASRHAELSPWLSGWRSAFRVRSQVWRGRPGQRLQSLGSPL